MQLAYSILITYGKILGITYLLMVAFWIYVSTR
jgi:hypothetical protein